MKLDLRIRLSRLIMPAFTFGLHFISECRHLFQLSIREPSYGRTGTWSCTCFLLFTFWPIREYVSQCSWIAFPKAKCKQIQLAF
jgi:hypothetical protein